MNPISDGQGDTETRTAGATLAEQRETIGQRLWDGASGAEVMAALTEGRAAIHLAWWARAHLASTVPRTIPRNDGRVGGWTSAR